MLDYIIYLLYNTKNNNTYIGITNNKERRIRQHNGELVGGAKYTHAKKDDGEWIYYGWIQSNTILIKNRALSLEKKIKNASKNMKGMPIEKRISAIYQILADNNDLTFIISICE